MRLLQGSLSFVLGLASVLLLLRLGREHPHGVHPALVAALAAVELLAALLFLIPRTLVWGARLLWGALAVAALLHLHSGQPPPSVFLVYAAGIWVVLHEARAPARTSS